MRVTLLDGKGTGGGRSVGEREAYIISGVNGLQQGFLEREKAQKMFEGGIVRAHGEMKHHS